MYQPEGEKSKRARRVVSSAGYKCGGHFAAGGGIRSDLAQDRLEITNAVHQHEGNMHPGMKKTALKLADGGIASGGAPPSRSDRPSRGKKGGSGKTHVNILIAPQGDKGGTEGPPPPGGMGPPPVPPAPPRPMPPMAPPTGAPPLGVGAPMGGAPPMGRPMPPVGPPMRKAGGSVRRRLQDGGASDMMRSQMQGAGGASANPYAALGGPPGWNPTPQGALTQAGMGQAGAPGMPMKSGGRSRYSPPKMEAGAGSGEGRLDKIGK